MSSSHLTHIFQRGRYTTNQVKTKHRTFSDFWILYFDPRLIGEIPSLSPLTVREYTIAYLVGGFKHFLFSIIYGIILPIDFHIFQDG